jgi:hypothetical protein
MLDESESPAIQSLLTADVQAIQAYREDHGATLAEALNVVRTQAACGQYFELTGFRETNAHALWHHRRSLFGPPCAGCGELLRTPRSRRCFACGRAA